MKPYYDDGQVTIYHGDCREVLADLGDVAGVVVTDPPYSSGGFQEAGKSAGSVGTRSGDSIALDNLSTRGYQRLLRSVFRHCNQADEVYLFTDWRMWTPASDAIEEAGWRVRNMLVWDKLTMGMGLPWRNQHELIVYGKRTPASMRDGKHGNVLQARRTGNDLHPTEKPLDLCQTILGNAGDGTVLDPFMGTGTTLLAAKLLGRRAVGIETEERYCEMAARRLAQECLALGG